MSRSLIYFYILCLIPWSLYGYQPEIYPVVTNKSFQRGEVLEFKMTYGIFTVGEGTAEVQKNYFKLKNRDCFKVEIKAETVGVANWIADVHNQYSAYIDTLSLLPLNFYRKQRENNYRKEERTDFNHETKKISVQTLDKETNKWKNPVIFDAPPEVREMISGFLLLRNMDLTNVSIKDTIIIKGFFEDEFYSLKIIYYGKEVISTKIGKIRTLIFKPVMPDNKLFRGENSVTAFFSDDKNRIPVKIETKMFIGNAGVELTGYKGLKNPLNLVKQ
jgi:hypothetical protein